MLEKDILISDVFIHKVLLEMCQEKRCILHIQMAQKLFTFPSFISQV